MNYTNWLRLKLCQKILFPANKGVANSCNPWNSWLSSELACEVEADVLEVLLGHLEDVA